MDVTASLISIVDLAWKVTKYLKDVKKGGSERQQLDGEVLSIYHLFHGLRDQFSEENIQDNEAYLKPVRTLLEPNGVIPQLNATLEEITAKLEKASETRIGKVAQSFTWPFLRDDAKNLIQRLDRLKSSVTMALGQIHIEQGRIGNLVISDIQQVVSTQHFLEVTEWMSPLDFLSIKETPLKKALAGTGRWFLEGDEFKVFKSGIAPVLWCSGIPGAGKTCLASAAFEELAAGADEKTVVLIGFCAFDIPRTHSAVEMLWSLLRQLVHMKGTCSETVDKLYTEHVKGQQNQSRPSVDQLCKVLATELGSFDRSFLVLDGLDEMPDQEEREDLLQRLEALDPRPRLMVTSRPLGNIRTWLTECASEGGYQVPPEAPAPAYCDICFSTTSSYYACGKCESTVCFTCYEDNKLCKSCNEDNFQLQYSASVVIAAQPEDIEQYVSSRINGNRALRRVIERGKSLLNEVIRKVKEDAQEMFLLARFHMDVIENETSPNGVRRALKDLPRGINETFDRTFDRIDRLGDATRVKRLISYVAFSNDILTVDALNHAVAVEPQDIVLDEDNISYVDDLAPMCAGLIEIGPLPERYVQLAHETIRRYINKSLRAPFSEAERPLAIACLTYLRFKNFDGGAADDEYENRKEQYPFLEYAALYWGSHVRTCCDNEVIKSKTLEFLHSQPHIENATEFMLYGDNEDSSSWDAKDDVTAIHLASYFGLPHVVSELISQGEDPNARDCLGTTGLMYAASKNFPEVVAVLLHSGATAATVCDRGSTALHRASKIGSKLIVQQLITSKQNVGINLLDTRNDNQTALMLAIRAGSVDVIQLLLQHPQIDANLLQPGSRGMSALLIATSYERSDVLETILDSGKVDINQTDTYGMTALSLAAQSCHRSTAEILLKHNADPGICDQYGGPPFLRAIDYNNIEVVRLFLDYDVDWTFKDFLGRNVLHGAAVNNRAFIMRLLLEAGKKTGNGVLVDEKDNKGETPLFDAARHDYDECVRVLLEFGARTDVMNNSGMTPVWSAREMGVQRVIPLLRKYRNTEVAAHNNPEQKRGSTIEEFHMPQRVDTFGDGYKLSLHAAARLLNAEAFKTQLATYSDPADKINATDEANAQTPLHIASLRGSLQIVELLLASDALVELHDQWGWTPLHLAVQRNNVKVAEVLVASGADVNAKDVLNRTPLDFATFDHTWLESAFFLITHGAIFDPHASEIAYLLHCAAAAGDLTVGKILVDKGVPYQLKDEWGLTPYQRAKQEGWDDFAQFLIGKSSSSTDKLATIGEATTDKAVQPSPLAEDATPEDQKELKSMIPESGIIEEPAPITADAPIEVKSSNQSTSQQEKSPVSTQSASTMSKPIARGETNASSHHSPLTKREMVLLALIVALVAMLVLR